MPVVIFTGPDGAGKSTQAKLLIEFLKKNHIKTRSSWIRALHSFALASSLFLIRLGFNRTVTNPYGNERIQMSLKRIPFVRKLWPYFEIFSMLPLALIRVIIPSFLGWTVVSERYTIDSLIAVAWLTEDPCFEYSFAARFLINLLKHDYYLINVDADYETICSRRGGTAEPKEFIELQRKYLSYFSKTIPMMKISTVNRTIDETFYQISSAVLEHIFRQDKRMTDKLLPLVEKRIQQNARTTSGEARGPIQKRQLKVLHVAHYYGGPGGVTTTINEYAKSSKHQHIVLTASEIAYQMSIGLPNLKIIRFRYRKEGSIPLVRNLVFAFPSWLEERKLLDNLDCDIIIVHGEGSTSLPFPTPIVSVASHVFGAHFDHLIWESFSAGKYPRTSIIFFHGLLSEQSRSFMVRKYYLAFERKLASTENGIIYADAYMEPALRQESDRPSLLWYSPVDSSVFHPVNREEAFDTLERAFGLDLRQIIKDDPVVLYYGRPDRTKGFGVLEAIAELERSFWLLLAGPTKLGTRVDIGRKILKLDLNFDNVHVPHLVALSTIVFNPVTINGISRVTIEAMLCGKAVAMMSHYNRYPLIEDQDFIGIKNHNARDIIAELEESISEVGRLERIALNARTKALATFDLKNNSERLDHFLEKVAESSN